MPRRYTDPIAQVIITDRDTGETWHWGSPQYPFLRSVSIAMDLGAVSAFSVGVDIPYDYARRVMNPNSTPFKMKNVVKARIGYASGGWIPWAEGTLLNGAKNVSMTADGAAGTLDIAWTSTTVLGYTPPIDFFKSAGLSTSRMLEEIARIMGFESVISSDASERMSRWEVAESAKSDSVDVKVREQAFYSALMNKSFMAIIKTVTSDNGCQWWFGRQGGIFGKKTLFVYTQEEITRGVSNSSEAPFKYVIRGIMDESIGQFPAYSFEPASDAASWVTNIPDASASGLQLTGINMDGDDNGEDDDKEEQMTIESSLQSIDGLLETRSPVSDIYDDIVSDIGKEGELGTFFATPLRANGWEIVKDQARGAMFVGDPGLHGTINSVGVPEEEIGRLCYLRGAGAINDGTYYIEKLTHIWTPGSWEMQVGVHRHGTKTVSGDHKQTAGGQMPQ